jgi:protein-S-isoprenylcysteine O-methyltransferase Ste14
MKRTLALIYGVVCYLFFLAVFLRAIWFVWTMDALPPKSPLGQAVLIDAVLLGLFAIQHSGMARQGFKRAWTKLVQQPVERSTYVLVASATLLAVVVFWQPMPQTIWRVESQPWVLLLQLLFWSAPHMTLGHLFFSVMCTGYILLAIQFEERDMVTFHGESYRVYRSGVSMLVPLPGRKKREV